MRIGLLSDSHDRVPAIRELLTQRRRVRNHLAIRTQFEFLLQQCFVYCCLSNCRSVFAIERQRTHQRQRHARIEGIRRGKCTPSLHRFRPHRVRTVREAGS